MRTTLTSSHDLVRTPQFCSIHLPACVCNISFLNISTSLKQFGNVRLPPTRPQNEMRQESLRLKFESIYFSALSRQVLSRF